MDVHVDMADWLVRGQVEDRLTVPAQVGRRGSRRQLEEVVLYDAAVDVDDDHSHRIAVERLDVVFLASL
ncbi:MAG: hypothetical protein F4X80_01930 [Chloroflexi bacterium]|nr:hypothetical protein [Chloroflexota bacterium]